MNLEPLIEPLENKPTVLRCFISMNLQPVFDAVKWGALNAEIIKFYKDNNDANNLKRINQKSIFGNPKYRHKIFLYPAEFIPKMLIIINKHYLMALPKQEPKPKRKRINNKIEII